MDRQGVTGMATAALSTAEDLFPLDSVYHQLIDLERDLDQKITRKQLQIADAAFKVGKIKRTLRVYILHTCENQGSVGIQIDNAPDAIPCWTVRIDARLETYGRQGRTALRPFSHYVKSLVVQVGDCRTPDQLLEWHKAASSAASAGEQVECFEIRRTGSTNVPLKIFLALDHQPEKYRLSPQLDAVLGLGVATRPQIVLAVWQYIKLHKLQESDEKKIVNCDETLRQLFGVARMSFSEIPVKLEPHLLPPLPIEMDYLVAVDRAEGSAVWDVEVEVEDPAKPRSTAASIVALQREIALIEQKMGELTTAIRASLHYRKVLSAFATDPARCMMKLMEEQTADQEVALFGEPALTAEDVNRSTGFDNEDIERAVELLASTM